jgi:hypothetical protein
VAALNSGARRAAAVVAGSAAAGDLVIARSVAGGVYAATPVPLRGTSRTVGFLVGDLDVDGDQDLVRLRDGSLPAILFQHEVQLAQTGVCQLGRSGTLRLRGPEGNSVHLFASASLTPVRLPVPGIGLLRLAPFGLVEVFNAAIPAAGVVEPPPIPTGPAWSPGEIPLQAAVLDLRALRVRLTNLEPFALVRF